MLGATMLGGAGHQRAGGPPGSTCLLEENQVCWLHAARAMFDDVAEARDSVPALCAHASGVPGSGPAVQLLPHPVQSSSSLRISATVIGSQFNAS
jgi:hypothetical protein